jgi:TonB-dependent starch-binding outer membrane protein SusC
MVCQLPLVRSLAARWLVGSVIALLSAGCMHSRATAPAGDPETVAIGYGSQSADDASHPVATLGTEEIGRVKASRLEELFQGKFAGVQVLRTQDGGFSVRIRGTGSPNRQGEPLYVIDGIPVRIAPGQGLTWINPADVARIDVLKGAAAGIYGFSGGNGVVLITTNRR